MKISPHPQGSIEWLESRKSVFTASEFAAFMISATTATAKESRMKYICGKLTDKMANDEFEQEAEDKAARFMALDPWVQRGNALEPLARTKLSKIIGKEIVETGLIFHDSGEFAASPDGLVVSDDGNEWEAGVEIKCHNRKRHLSDLLAGVLPSDHKFQVHGSMCVTGLKKWHYFAFHPAQPSLHILVEWDSFTDQLLAGLIEMASEKAIIKNRLRDLWNAEMKEITA